MNFMNIVNSYRLNKDESKIQVEINEISRQRNALPYTILSMSPTDRAAHAEDSLKRILKSLPEQHDREEYIKKVFAYSQIEERYTKYTPWIICMTNAQIIANKEYMMISVDDVDLKNYIRNSINNTEILLTDQLVVFGKYRDGSCILL